MIPTLKLLLVIAGVIVVGVVSIIWSDYLTWRALQKRLEKEKELKAEGSRTLGETQEIEP